MFSLRLALGIGAAKVSRCSCGTSRIPLQLMRTTNSRSLATGTDPTNPGPDRTQETVKAGGFAKAFEKQSQITDDTQETEEPKTFASLLRHHKLMDVSFALHF